jgi:hypothetical protein
MALEDRLRRLEDRAAIRELRHEYCYRIDDFDFDGFAALFTDDARVDFGPAGTYEGRDEVRQFAREVVGEEYTFLAHMVHNPIIDLDGETASGRWYFEVPCIQARNDRAAWM